MDWTFVYLMFVLKIPIVLLLWIVWWSTRPVEETGNGDDEGGQRREHPRHPRPPLPRLPRRGPHGGDRLAPAPPRVRSVVARSDASHSA